MLRAIDIKVLRDLNRMRGQAAAIGLVIACGVAVYLGMHGTMRSLESARADYYAEQRFGDVFAVLKRAPERISDLLERIPGVQAVETQVKAGATLDVPGLVEAASAQLVSLPDYGRPAINGLWLRAGRLPAPGQVREVVANEAFMEAHDFELGQTVGVVLNGARLELSVVGIGLSPEYTITVAPGLLIPDDRLFGVFWMRRAALGAAYDMDGAFNTVSLRLARDAPVEAVLGQVDDALDDYGGLGAVARRDQLSAFLVQNELAQLRDMAFLPPLLFLSVAAFLLNIVLGRLVAGQRGDIAALKAFGYRDAEIAAHYAKLLALIVLGGWLLGLGGAYWMGHGMTGLYAAYYRFPALPFEMGLRAPLQALALTVCSAGIGGWSAVHRTLSLQPAEAMRPAAPPSYRPTIVERIGLAPLLPTALRLVLRELERKPVRAVLSITGVALATALTIVMAFTLDSMLRMLNVQFGLSQREDVQLVLAEARSTGVLAELEALPGVLHAEPYRDVAVEFEHGPRSKRGALTGLPRDTRLVGLLDEDLRDVSLPPDGLVLSAKLAELLDVGVGDTLDVRVLQGHRRRGRLRVARVVETYMGTAAYLRLESLSRMLGEAPALNGARLLIDDARLGELHASVKDTPIVSGVTSRDAVLRNVRRMLDQNMGIMTAFSLGFALVMSFGVLYNTARITLAERARELATLRVLGFRRSEVAAILIGEMTIVVAVALPLGLATGYGLAALLVRTPSFNTEEFRLPLVVSSATYATAALAVLTAGAVSGFAAWRRLDAFDIVEVLKTRD